MNYSYKLKKKWNKPSLRTLVFAKTSSDTGYGGDLADMDS